MTDTTKAADLKSSLTAGIRAEGFFDFFVILTALRDVMGNFLDILLLFHTAYGLSIRGRQLDGVICHKSQLLIDNFK